jgi:hypothetical protein
MLRQSVHRRAIVPHRLHITQGFVLPGAVLLESAIAMVLLSRILPYRANRWANISVGVIQIGANVQALTGSLYRNLYFELFTGIELACLVFIIWSAWTWPHTESGMLNGHDRSGVEGRGTA